MAKIYGKDIYLIEQKFSHKTDGLFLVYIFFVAIITYWIYLFSFGFPHLGSNIAGSLLLIFYIIMRGPIERKLWKLRRLARGLGGEEDVRSVLLQLSHDYVIIENLIIPPLTSNIDFVVIGPTGVFALEVKSHVGNISYSDNKLYVRGVFKGDFLKQSRGGAIRLNDYLHNKNIVSPRIAPILVFSSPYAVLRFGMKPIDDVLVIGSKWLLRSIQENPTVLTIDQVETISNTLLELLPKNSQ